MFCLLFIDEVIERGLFVDDEFVKEVRDVLLALFCGFVEERLVARAGIEVQFRLYAEISIHLVEFFDALPVVADHIVRAREHPDSGCRVEFCAVLSSIQFRGLAHHIEVKADAHIRVGVFASRKLLPALGNAVDPLPFAFVALELDKTVRNFVDQLRSPISRKEEDRKGEALAEVEEPSHVSRTDERDRSDVRPRLRKGLREETAIGVTEEEDRQVVLLFEPLAEEEFVLQSLFEDIALVLASVFVRLSPTVRAVVVAEDDISASVEVSCDLVVVSGVFRHTVNELNNSLWCVNVVPKRAVDFSSVKTLEFEFLHRATLNVYYIQYKPNI